MNSRISDRLGISSTVGLLVLGMAALAIFFILTDASLRSNADYADSIELVRSLGLTNLSLVPTGRPLRAPDMTHPAIDLRFDPKLGRSHLDPAFLIFNVRD